MRIKSFIVIGLFFVLLGCKKDDNSTNNGDLYVTVYASTPIKGANVFTVPATKQGLTDAFGTVMLKDLAPGSYEVYASLNNYGTGKAIVRILSDSLKTVDIQLIYNVVTGFTPEIELLLPDIPANFTLNEKIIFSFIVRDEDTNPEDISVEITSNLDGKLIETHPDASNNVIFETSSLSSGKHLITIQATDKDNYTNSIEIEVSTLSPGNIFLESATGVMGSVQLQWQKYSLDDFKRYEVFRSTELNSTGQLIASFSSIDSIKFMDKLPPYASEVYYYVQITNTGDQTRISNSIKVTEPAGKIYYYSVTDAVHNPTEPILYIVDAFSQKLIALDYQTQKEITSVRLQGEVGKIDIGDNGFGLEIYVPNNNGIIDVYNAISLDFVTSINTGLPTSSIVTNQNGYLVASVAPSPWWEQPVRTYSRKSGAYLSGNIGNGVFESNILRFIPNTDNVISISTTVSPTDMDFFTLDKSGIILSNEDDKYHGDHPLDPSIFRISSNGEYLLTGNYGAVYSATNSMTYKGIIDGGALLFSDFAFNKDGNTIYAGTSNRNSIQVINYPSLTRNDEILMKGYPKFLFYHNGMIISISLTDLNNDNVGIEMVGIDK